MPRNNEPPLPPVPILTDDQQAFIMDLKDTIDAVTNHGIALDPTHGFVFLVLGFGVLYAHGNTELREAADRARLAASDLWTLFTAAIAAKESQS